MNHANDTAILRRRIDAIETAMDSQDGGASQEGTSLIVQTFTEAAYPSAALKVFACHPVTVGGTEQEGAAVSLVAEADILYVANVGIVNPPNGTMLEATLHDGRWVMRYDG